MWENAGCKSQNSRSLSSSQWEWKKESILTGERMTRDSFRKAWSSKEDGSLWVLSACENRVTPGIPCCSGTISVLEANPMKAFDWWFCFRPVPSKIPFSPLQNGNANSFVKIHRGLEAYPREGMESQGASGIIVEGNRQSGGGCGIGIFFFFMPHWWFSGVTPGSGRLLLPMLGGPYVVPGMEPRLATCKAQILYLLYYGSGFWCWTVFLQEILQVSPVNHNA